MMKLTFAVFAALLAVTNGIRIEDDDIQQLPEVENETDA